MSRKHEKTNYCSCENGAGADKPVNANQISPNDTWVIARAKPIMVKAKKINTKFYVNTLEGQQTGRKGDYLVIGSFGERYIIRSEIFESTCEIMGNYGK
jgi:hypothetical protein